MFKFLIFQFICLHFIETRPLNERLIDMTHVNDETTLFIPIFRNFTIDKLVKGPSKFLVTNWLQFEEFTTSTHTGTHMDAPAHVIKGGVTIDKVPLQDFFGPAAVIDINYKSSTNRDAEATIEDLLHWESISGQSLNGTILLLNSGWGHNWNNRTAFLGTSGNDITKMHFPGFSSTACEWLVNNRNIKGVGSDAASIDVGTTTSFPCHGSILGRNLFILESVANVDKIPVYGTQLYMFPMKIGKGSGAPTRIVARIP